MDHVRTQRSGDFAQTLLQTRQSLNNVLDRVSELNQQPGTDPTWRESILFNLERSAWLAIELANAWVYEHRLGVPGRETESIDALQKQGWLALDEAKRLKQLTEYRKFSGREIERIDWENLLAELPGDIALFRAWAGREFTAREQ